MPRGRLGVRDVRRRRRRLCIARDMRPSGVALADGVRRGRARAAGPRSSTSAWARRTSSTSPRATSTAPARCSPRRTTPPSTTASSCASPGRGPSGVESGLREVKALTARVPRRARRPARLARASSTSTCSMPGPTTCGASSTPRCCARCASCATRPTAWAGSSRPLVFDPLPFEVDVPLPRARRHLPEPPRRPDPAREPRRPAGDGCASGRRRRARLRRRRGPGVPHRRARRGRLGVAHDRARRRRRCWRKLPRLDGPLQPHLLEGRPRDGRPRSAARRSGRGSATASSSRSWPRPARSSAASTPGTTTTATTSAPTRASSPRCSSSSS